MKPVRCNNCKLFYNSEVYNQCPYCEDTAPQSQEEKKNNAIADLPMIENEENKITVNKRKDDENNFTPHSAKAHPHVIAVAKPAEPVEPEEPFSPAEPEDEIEEKTEPADAVKVEAVPENVVAINNCTVGWLVCLKGEYLGKSFVLKPGQNSIGRDSEMQVSLPEEKRLLNHNHAAVFYNEKLNRFRLIPGDARGLTFLNDDLKVSECDLRPGDKISIGDVTFIFVPLCGSKFKWDEYVK